MSKLIVEMEMPKRCIKCGARLKCKRYVCGLQQDIAEDLKPLMGDKDCLIKGVLPEEHGPLVDFNDVSKELRKYGYIVKDEITGMQHMEYPIVLEQNPIRIPTIVPAERKDDELPC